MAKDLANKKEQIYSKLEKVQKKMKINFKENEDSYFDKAGSDIEEYFYDADGEQDKHHAWKNLLIAGKFTHWKPKSLMPIPRFIDKLKYNKESHIRLCELGKDTYEAEL